MKLVRLNRGLQHAPTSSCTTTTLLLTLGLGPQPLVSVGEGAPRLAQLAVRVPLMATSPHSLPCVHSFLLLHIVFFLMVELCQFSI